MAFSLKDIQDTLRSLQIEGRRIDELEGLLINTDDLLELLKSIPEYRNGMSRDIKLFGVKIMESKYAKKGTIFRIFKTDEKLYVPQITNGMNNFGPYVRDDVIEQCKNSPSGTMPSPDFKEKIQGSWLIVDAGPYVDIDDWEDTGDNEIIRMPDNMKLPTMADSRKKKKKQKRHSKTRKIDLG